MGIKEVLSRWFAIYATAKRYHWKTSSSIFESDHLLFDTISDCWSKKLNDSIIEKYYMSTRRDLLDEVDSIFEESNKYRGKDLSCYSVQDSTDMAMELYKIVDLLVKGIQDCNGEDRGVNAELDVLASNLSTARALLLGRIHYKIKK